jgi:hypothetical protein
MFFGGTDVNAGVCINDGRRHVAQGFEFSLTFTDGPPPPNTENNWFFCRKCSVLFHVKVGGHAGTCVKGGGHDSTGSLNFALPANIAEPPGSQENWRRCKKCHSLYFGGNPGRCVKGAGHEKPDNPNNFVLPHGANFIPKSVPLAEPEGIPAPPE